jgi:hypothetical protein
MQYSLNKSDCMAINYCPGASHLHSWPGQRSPFRLRPPNFRASALQPSSNPPPSLSIRTLDKTASITPRANLQLSVSQYPSGSRMLRLCLPIIPGDTHCPVCIFCQARYQTVGSSLCLIQQEKETNFCAAAHPSERRSVMPGVLSNSPAAAVPVPCLPV